MTIHRFAQLFAAVAILLWLIQSLHDYLAKRRYERKAQVEGALRSKALAPQPKSDPSSEVESVELT